MYNIFAHTVFYHRVIVVILLQIASTAFIHQEDIVLLV